MTVPFLPGLEKVFGWLLSVSWQASVLALFILLIQRVLGSRLNPRWRYALWLLVLLRLISPVLPESALSLFQFAPPPPAALTLSVTEPLFSSEPVPTPSVSFTEIPKPAHPVSAYSLLAIIWLLGAILLSILTWQVNRRFARQVANSAAISDPELLHLFTRAKTELRLSRSIRLIENGQVESPAIMGLFQPTLLLPVDVRTKFDATELRLIFLHELAHLKRGDILIQALIALLQILHWFNPVLWYAFRRMRIDREPATDALVLSRTGEAEKERYGLMLIKLLENFNQRHSLPTLVGILEDKDQFKRRFSLISKFTRGAYGWSLLGVVILAALAIAGLTQANRFVKDPNLPYVVDLQPFYHRVFHDPGGADSRYLGFAGRQVIDGLPFDIGGEIVLYGQSAAQRNVDQPNGVAGIKIGRKFDELHLVHAAQWREYYGCPVATVRLHYADGTQTDFIIRDEFQVNDWNRLLTENDEFVADPDTKIIWRGAGIVKGTGRLFKSVLHNPSPDKVVDTMEVISARSYMSYILVAATVAQTDPARAVTPPLTLYPSRNFDTTLKVHVTDKTTGKPIAEAEVYTAWIVQDVNLVGDPVLTGPDGVAAIQYPKAEATDLQIEIGKTGYLMNDTNWQNGLDVANAPPDITYQLTPGRDPSLDTRQVIGHWKAGPGLTAGFDFSGTVVYLTSKMGPPPKPASMDTPEKKQEWLQNWLVTTKEGKEFVKRSKVLRLEADGTFGGTGVEPGEYILSSGVIGNNGQPNAQIDSRTVTVPENPSTDPNTLVDLGEIVLQPIPSEQTSKADSANPQGDQVPPAATQTVATLPDLGQIPRGMVRVAAKVVQISDADYQAHQGEIDDAAQRGDVEPLSRLKSFNLISEPAVLTKSGEQAVMEAVRVVPYPIAFKKDENGKTVPTDFARKNIGVRFVLKPTYTNGKIDITGALTVSSLQGWKKIDANASQPIFRDDGIPSVSVTLESGQTVALKTQYPAPLADNPTAFFGPDDTTRQPSKELRRIFLFLTAVAYPPATNASPGPAATPAPQPFRQNPSFANESGYHGSPINTPLHVVMTLVEVDEKAYELDAAAMDNAVKNGDSHFFVQREGTYVAPDATIDFPTDKGWYSLGYVQSYVGSVKYEKIQGTVHTTLQAVSVFNGINADFAISSLPGNISIDSTWSDVEPTEAHKQNLDPKFSGAKFPMTLDLTPTMHTAKFTDRGWKIEPGVTHGFWVGETLGQFTRTTHFGDLSHTTLEEMVKTRKPSLLAVFMTAQPATPPLDPAAQLTYKLQQQPIPSGGTQTLYSNAQPVVGGQLAPNPARDKELIDLVRDGHTDKIGNGDFDQVGRLLAQGADPNAKDKDGTSALTWALNFGKDDAAQLLIQHGADGTPVDSNGENAAWLAAKIYFCPGALDLLIKKGVSIAGLNKNGQPILISMLSVRTPIPGKMNYLNDRVWTDADMKAYDEREHRTVDLLVAAGADFNGRNGVQTPLMRAVLSGHAEAVRALLAHGANVTFKDAGGQTALTTAQAFHPELAPLIEEALAHPAAPATDNNLPADPRAAPHQ
jgi:beta-lactamase regulating signal transducer with metallopeptidase domain